MTRLFLWLTICCWLCGFIPLRAERLFPVEETGGFVYRENGHVYGTPEILEKGGQWHMTENTEGVRVVMAELGNESFRLPVRMIDGRKLIDLSLFEPFAGLSHEVNEKTHEIFFRKEATRGIDDGGKKQKMLGGETVGTELLLVWDPENAFDVRRPFFSADAGRRILAPDWGKWEKFLSVDVCFDDGYVRRVHEVGAEVTPLVHNDFNPSETSQLLCDEELRQKLIHRMAGVAIICDLDGYNIDYENVNPKDKEKFTDFVRALTNCLYVYGKIVTVDITVLGSETSFWHGAYDRNALAKAADYVVLMGYDQTPGGSRVAGTVSGYGWLDTSLSEMVKQVPPEKMILGLPLYTRVWTGPHGDVRGQTLAMKHLQEYLRSRGLYPMWDYKNCQYYAEWREEGALKRLWLEEGKSLGMKLGLVKKYGLAGSAYWRYGFESDDIYERLEEKLQ